MKTWVLEVIESCLNRDQLIVAHNLANQYYKQIGWDEEIQSAYLDKMMRL